ncbi:MAG: Nif3-like dinuclear metal center hexameric protein [Candidatus Korobacteraceae bacterium]
MNRDALRPACLAILVIAVLTPAAESQTLTAAEAIQRIQHHYAVPVPTNTVDTVKAGDPSTPVTGIAVTFLDTMDVLRQANQHGLNLVITHEPTFYNHLDETAFFADDPVYREKLAFIQQHHMVVFRLHDQIHSVSPDPIARALVAALGWQGYSEAANPFRATIPKTSLAKLSVELAKKLDAKTVRVIGDPDLSITHVALIPGAAGLQKQVLALRDKDVEVVIVGESAEWEGVEYTRDASAQGRHKAMIVLGHEVSEEPGMKWCAEDLRALFPSLQVVHIPAGQPFWTPEHPPASAANSRSAR